MVSAIPLSVVIALAALFAMAAGADPLRIGRERQLFVDDYVIESMDGLRRTVHQWQKHPDNPVLRAEMPWEGGGTYALAYGSALFDEQEQLFKMWYWAPHDGGEAMLYATSRDGVHWERPDLGLFEFHGSRDNNICVVSASGDMETYGCFKDLDDPDPARLYKALLWERVAPGTWGENDPPEKLGGVWTATSPDGIHWTKSRRPVVPHPPAGDTVGFLDSRADGRYVGFVKIQTDRGRSRAIMESDDFETWSEPRLIFASDDEDDQPCDVYNNTAFSYEGLYLGWLQMYYHHQDPYRRRLEVELIYSRDGREWHRMPGRESVLPVGPDGAWDRTNQSPANGRPIRVGDRLYMYYGGRTYYHPPYKGGEGRCSIGLGTLRVDGFVSLDANPFGGTMTTKPVLLQGSRLYVNCASDWGHLRVEVLGEDGEPLPGCAREDCDDIRADGVRLPVSWRGNADLGVLQDRPVRLRFHLQNARLYSFWVE
ncbi:MAG: hypothetical protein JSV65_03165 [Armatimonadota bacterium]|nr:MAG: hypothetical protein JSV65_03165 [Armatimonadota bacterium]